jgi:hypothetical protein
MDEFFRTVGVQTLAGLAHPTNTYNSGKYKINDYTIGVLIIYDENYVTELELTKEGSFFTNIRVVKDNDWVSPFAGIELIKDAALDYINSNSDKEHQSLFEKKINKTISEMDGRDLACLILSLKWLNY